MCLCQLAIELLEVIEDKESIFITALVEEGLVLIVRADVVGRDVVLPLLWVIVRPDEHLLVVDAVLAWVDTSGALFT